MKKRSPWVVFCVLLSGIFVTLEATTFMSPSLPYISKYFNLPTQYAGIVSVMYYITAIALAPLFGRLGDQIGRKKIVVLGLLVFALAEFLGASSTTLSVFLLARFIQGIGYACIFPNVFAFVTDLFTEEKRGRAIGVLMLFTYIATATGGIIAGFLIDAFSWRAVFFTSGTLATIGLLLVMFIVPKDALENTKAKVNYGGASIFMLVIASIVSIPITIGNFGLFSLATLIQVVVIALILAILLRTDRKNKTPILDLAVLKIREIKISAILITFQNLIMLSIINSLVFYGLSRSDWTAIEIGLITTVNFTIAAVLSPFIGRYLDKYKAAYLIIIALISSLVGVSIFYFVNMESSLLYVLSIMVFIGICSGCLNAALMKIVITEAPEGKKGTGTGLFTLFKDLGLPLGSTFGTTLYGISQVKGFEKNVGGVAESNGLDAALASDILVARNGGEVSVTLGNALDAANLTFEQLLVKVNAVSIESAIHTVGIVNFGLCIGIILISLLLFKKKPVTTQQENPSELAET